MAEFRGQLIAKDVHIGIVISRFNDMITKQLYEGAIDACHSYGVIEKNIAVAWVPGAFEIPVVSKAMAESGNYDAIICLGAVIRGSTPHFDYICSQTSAGISTVALETGIPMIFGVLTVDTIEQAMERAGTKMGNKGFESVQVAIEMIDLMRQLAKNKNRK